MDVRLPDGTIIRGVPDGTTRDELTAKLRANGYNIEEPKPDAPPPTKEEKGRDAVKTALRLATPAGVAGALFSEEGRQDLKNAVMGGVRGAGSIGATLIAPFEGMEANRERRASMDAGLTQLGADTQSLPFEVGKLTTEVGGTWAIPGAVGGQVAKVAPRVGAAIASGGFNTGQRVVPGVVNKLVDAGIRATGGAVGGGLMAGAVNPDDAPLGAAVGGVAPVAARVVGATGNAIGSAVSRRSADKRAVNKLSEALGERGASQVSADIQTHMPRGAEDIPLSAAAITKNAELAALEQGSRLRNSPAWYDFDVKQGKAAWENVSKATQEADELGKRAKTRRDNWKAAWEAASESQKPRVWQKRMTQFGADMETALRSPDASNPSVRQVLEAINQEMDRVGPDFSMGHLQQLRANLEGKVQPMSQDAFKSAPRDNPAIISIKKEMDDILNAATGGKWQKVIEGYAKDSQSLHASKASQKVSNAYVDSETGRVVSPVIGADTPRVTAANLTNAMNAARQPDKSLALSGEANQRLEATIEALRRQGMVQELKRSALAGGGSDTVPNAIAAGAQAAGAPNMLMQLMGAVRQMGSGKTDEAMARLLANPDELAAALSRYFGPQPTNRLSLALRPAPAALADR
jgi:glycosyltransferase A (GT-A) superfamily protein (DUF2064 family)